VTFFFSFFFCQSLIEKELDKTKNSAVSECNTSEGGKLMIAFNQHLP